MSRYDLETKNGCIPKFGHNGPLNKCPRENWVPNSDCANCLKCDQEFNIFNRRHHCRACGKCFCTTCCSKYIDIDNGLEIKQKRVCDNCKEISDRRQKSFNPLSKRVSRPLSAADIQRLQRGRSQLEREMEGEMEAYHQKLRMGPRLGELYKRQGEVLPEYVVTLAEQMNKRLAMGYRRTKRRRRKRRKGRGKVRGKGKKNPTKKRRRNTRRGRGKGKGKSKGTKKSRKKR